MRLLGKPLHEVTPEDIQRLVEQQVQESISLEYKSQFPDLKKDSEKKKFLADVCALANRVGGVIIYGIEEDKDEEGKNTGIARQISGIDEVNLDIVRQQCEQVIRTGIEPVIKSIAIEEKKVTDKTVLLVGISRSLSAPHMVCFDKSGKFYSRNSAGKYQMNVHEIRQAFNETSEWISTANKFRTDRIDIMQSGRGVPNMRIERHLILHILPLGGNRDLIDVTSLATRFRRRFAGNLLPYDKFNLEGYTAHGGSGIDGQYILLHRSGALEGVYRLPAAFVQGPEPQRMVIFGDRIELACLGTLRSYLSFAGENEIMPPLCFFLTLLGVENAYMHLHDLCGYEFPALREYKHLTPMDVEGPLIDRNNIMFDGIYIDNTGQDANDILAPVFNILWQAGGQSKSPLNKETRQRLLDQDARLRRP